jgi:hypothetical protein
LFSLFRLLKYFLIIAIVFLISQIFVINPVKAQGALVSEIQNLQINANVSNNGELNTTETFNFTDNLASSFWWIINSANIKNLEIYQNNQIIPKTNYQTKVVDNQTEILGLTNNNSQDTWQIKFVEKGGFTLNNNGIEFRYEPIKNPGFDIGSLNVNIKFNKTLDPQKTSQVLYAVHGVDNPKFNFQEDTLTYAGNNLSSYSSFTAVADLENGIVKIPLADQILKILNIGGFNFWVITTIALPVLVFLVLLIMLLIKRKRENIHTPENYLPHPPSNMDPILVGLLFRQRISAREITGEILSLAIKKYLMILQKYNGYTLGERQSTTSLESYDRALVDELLKGHLKETLANLKEQPQEELFSQAIYRVYNKAYESIAKLGYFVRNPKTVAITYKFYGMVLFFASVIAFFVTPFFVDPPYITFAFFGTAIASLIIIDLSSKMPYKTKVGQIALEDWLAFRKYLINYPDKPAFNEISQDKFIDYLPYAVVLDCEKEWADHFVSVPFKMPDWYTPYEYSEITSLTEFTKSFYPLIDSISATMLSMKEPIL